MGDDKFTPLEKLAIAGYAAARIRSSKVRKITTVDADGKPVRVLRSDELQGLLLERQGIELDAEGMIDCVSCRARFAAPKTHTARLCRRCRKIAAVEVEKLMSCVRCRRRLTSGRARVRVNSGLTATCYECGMAEKIGTREERARAKAAAKAAWDAGKKARRQQGAEKCRAKRAALSQDERDRIIAKQKAGIRAREAAMTPEQKEARRQRMVGNLQHIPPEKRRENSRKANEAQRLLRAQRDDGAPPRTVKLKQAAPVRARRPRNTKFTEATVIECRERHRAGAAIKALGRLYGADPATVRAIVRGETWKHVG